MQSESGMTEKLLGAIRSSMESQNTKIETLKHMLQALDADLVGVNDKPMLDRSTEQFEVNEQVSSMRSEQRKRKLDTMVNSLSALQSENVNITESVDWEQRSSAKEFDVDELQSIIGLVAQQSGKLKRIDQEIRDYGSGVTEMNAADIELSAFDMREALSSIKAEYTQIRAHSQTLERDNKAQKRQYDEAQKTVDSVRKELSHAQRHNDGLCSAMTRVESERDAVRRKVDELGRTVQLQQSNLEKYQSSKQTEIDVVRREVSDAQGREHHLQKENESMRDALREMHQEMDELRTQKVTLAADVQTAERMRRMLEQQVEAIQQEMAAQQHEIERMREANDNNNMNT